MSILIVDDDLDTGRMWTTWLASNLPQFSVVHATTLAEARTALVASPTLAVLLDVHLASEDGLDLLRELRGAGDPTPVLVVTGDPALRLRAHQALALGASIAFKPVDLVEVVPFLELAVAHPRTQRVSLSLLAQAGRLDPRETDALAALAVNASSRQIAAALFVTIPAAKNLVQRVLDKLGFDSRAQLVQFLYARSCAPDVVSTGGRRAPKQAG